MKETYALKKWSRKKPSIFDKSHIILCVLMLFIFNILTGQQLQFSVTGRVTDEKGNPLPGANVVIEGTTTGTMTDQDGNYNLLADKNSFLSFSFIGYDKQKINVEGKARIDVTLVESHGLLDEVVVIGYGTQKKKELTGAVGVVSAENLKNRAVTSVTQALQGMVSGLNVVRQSGQPGVENFDFKIRGTSTFSSNPVLIIVDGIPSSLERINPNDIETISVLKDAASAAIYGSRATGGVILVTTKTGKIGALRVNVNSTVSIQSPTRFPSKVSALEHMIAQNEMRFNDGGSPKYTEAEIEAAKSPDFKEWDWDGFMFNNAMQTNQNLSISGGTNVHNYYVSFGYLKQDGIFINSGYDRFNFQVNQNIKLSKKLKLGIKASYSPSTRTAPSSVIFAHIAQTSRLIGIRTDDGKWLTHPERTGDGRNPIARASEDGGQELLKSNLLLGNFSLDYEILPNLVVTGTYGINYDQSRKRNYRKILTFYNQYNPDQIASKEDWNILDINNASDIYNNTSLFTNYTKKIGDHNFTVLAGITSEWYEEQNDRVITKDFLTEELYVIDAGSKDKTLWDISGSAADWALASVISRATYSYKDRYILSGTVRYDGSSRFTEDNRWGLFPSASLAWIVSDESFLKNNRILTFLKLRGSWGQVGNQNVGFYPFANVLSQSAAYFGGTTYRAVGTSGSPNPSLTWETKEAFNVGIEGRLFENLFEFNIELFKEKTKDILLQLLLPTTYGQSAPVQNAGRVDNMGWEIELKHRHTFGDFSYGISFQVSDVINEVIDMKGISPIISGNKITEEGHPMDEWYGLRAIGLFQTAEEVASNPFQNVITSPGDIKYQENGGDPLIVNSDDRVRLGRSDPRFPYGIRTNLSYKNFDLIVFGQGVMGNLTFSNGPTAFNFDADATTIRTYQLDSWSPENTDARFPKFRNGQATLINTQFSSFWLEDASYFRLKQIELGYTIPDKIMKRLNIVGARIFASAENLFVITDYLGYDPEMPNATSYPLPRLVSFGVNFNF